MRLHDPITLLKDAQSMELERMLGEEPMTAGERAKRNTRNSFKVSSVIGVLCLRKRPGCIHMSGVEWRRKIVACCGGGRSVRIRVGILRTILGIVG